MLGRRFISFLKRSPSSSVSSQASSSGEEVSGKPWGRRVVSGVLICLTGGVALSALDDLAIYHGCSSKAMEKASKSEAVTNAIGEPIVRGPWYNASLAVAHKRRSVSCTFPVSGPQGTGIFQLKAVRNGDNTWFSFLRPHDWEILVMEALLHAPGNDEKQQTFRISVSDNLPPRQQLQFAQHALFPVLSLQRISRRNNYQSGGLKIHKLVMSFFQFNLLSPSSLQVSAISKPY